jgi:universal stress protein E
VGLQVEAMAPEAVAHLLTEVREHLEGLMAAVRARGGEVESLVRSCEFPHMVILKEALKLNPDLIVMGRRGRTGLSRLMLGSVTARVIGESPVKVLVVPREAQLAFKRLLIATDGSPDSQAAWDEACTLARRSGATLTAVCAAADEQELAAAREILRRLQDEASGCAFEALAPLGQPEEAILAAARDTRADLIILGTRGRTGLKRLLMGSVAERVIGDSPGPVLVVKQGAVGKS